MSKADVFDNFRIVQVDPDEAHNFCVTVGELVVIDFRLTFIGWSGSPGFWGVMSAAAEHAPCNTTIKFNPPLRRWKRNGGPRKGRGSVGRWKTHPDSAGRKTQSARWEGNRLNIHFSRPCM